MNFKKIFFYIVLFLLIFLFFIVIFFAKDYFNILNLCFNKNMTLTLNLHIVICAVFALISIFIILDILLVLYNGKIENKGLKIKEDDATFGTANWMNKNDISNILGVNDIPGIILGKSEDTTVKLPFDSYFNKNICVFGSSR